MAGTQSRAEQRRVQLDARRAREAKQKQRRVVLIVVGALLAVAAVVGIVVGTTQSNKQTSAGGKVPPAATAAGGIVVGSPQAPVKVVLFEDPQCPVCGRFEAGNGLVLRKAVEDGKVAVEYRMRSFLGPESVRAVNALAAAQAAGKFEALRELLYANQPPERTGGYDTQTLLRLGEQAGITDGAYARDVKAMAYEGWVHTVDDRASKDGNVGTPELRRNGSVVPSTVILGGEDAFRTALGM